MEENKIIPFKYADLSKADLKSANMNQYVFKYLKADLKQADLRR